MDESERTRDTKKSDYLQHESPHILKHSSSSGSGQIRAILIVMIDHIEQTLRKHLRYGQLVLLQPPEVLA